jgi:hypothetical protein
MTFQPKVCVVDFHHQHGPVVQEWIGVEEGTDPAWQNDIPFLAIPDGAHQVDEEFAYFSLVHRATGTGEDIVATSVFGISCMLQIDSGELLFRPPEVTRSAVQKAVVVITDRPSLALRERLSVVTRAWFAQKDFRDIEILQVGQWHDRVGLGRIHADL